jgi:hypothetical protein
MWHGGADLADPTISIERNFWQSSAFAKVFSSRTSLFFNAIA